MSNFAKMKLLEHKIPIVEIPIESKVRLFIKREDLTHPEISGNKYWKMFYNVKKYLEKEVSERKIITFGGAFSNHIAAAAALGKEFGIKTLGVIRGNELEDSWQENPTLFSAHQNGMSFRFVTRETYRYKEKMMKELQEEFPEALVIPEGGTNDLAIKGTAQILTDFDRENFDVICCAVGTGGTIAGLINTSTPQQKVIGFSALKGDFLNDEVRKWTTRDNWQIYPDDTFGGYAKYDERLLNFIEDVSEKYQLPLEPIYTGKAFYQLWQLIQHNHFTASTRILFIHTGGLHSNIPPH